MNRRAGALLCAALSLLGARPAQAALQLCNQTSYILYAAAGWKANTDNVTQGWTRVEPGDCQTVLTTALTAPAYFLYARSSRAHSGTARAWGGSVPLCVKDTNFSLKTAALAPTCSSDDAFTVSFAPLDTHAMQSWTATLTEAPAIHSLADARDTGLDRLLGDLGYKTGALGGQVRIDSLKAFRARMKLGLHATTGDYFDALETEAMKAASPAGYSICNDTAGVVWAALAFRTAKSALSAGWWKVPPGGCAHALTLPLNMDKVFLHAEGHNKPGLVSGPAKFCLTNITFQTTDTDRCAAHGLSEAGFAATGTKGLAGYTAHIGADGLVPAAPVQAAIPK